MTADIDPAIVEAVEAWFGEHLTYDAFEGCSDHDLALQIEPLIADAVKAAEAEGFKRGAAAVRAAVEAVARQWPNVRLYGERQTPFSNGARLMAETVLRAADATEDQP